MKIYFFTILRINSNKPLIKYSSLVSPTFYLKILDIRNIYPQLIRLSYKPITQYYFGCRKQADLKGSRYE